MTGDLHRALDDLVQDVAAGAGDRTRAGVGLRVPHMTARAHRNRVRRTVLTSAVATCAVLGVVAGGVAAATLDRSAPTVPAVPPTSPPSTPSPTGGPGPRSIPSTDASPAATVLPSGDASVPFGACGSLVSSATELPPAPDALTYPMTTSVAPAATGGTVLEVRSRLRVADNALVTFEADTGPTIVLARDGVVVAVTPTYPPGASTGTVHPVEDTSAGPSGVEFVSHLTPTVCDAPGATAGAVLPPGEYQVLPLAEVWVADREAAYAVLSDGTRTIADLEPQLALEHAVVVGTAALADLSQGVAGTGAIAPAAGTVPVLGDRNVADDDVDYPDLCEETLTPGDAGGLLPLTGPAEPVTAGTDVAMTVTSGGHGRVAFTLSSGFLRLVRDGRVVAVSATTTGARADLDHTGTFVVTVPTTSWTTCADGADSPGSMLTPGDYDAYPVELIGVNGLVAADGTEVVGRGSEVALHQLVGAPFTLTLG